MATASPPELAEDEVDRLLRLLARLPAVLPLADLPRVLGMPLEAATEALGALAERGLVEAWESPCGPAVTLTGLAAERLGRELSAPERRSVETRSGLRDMRWIERGGAEPERASLKLGARVVLDGDLLNSEAGAPGVQVGLDSLPDPRPLDPAYVPPAWSIRILSNPGMLLLGFGLVGWTPAVEGRSPCPVCCGRDLNRLAVCLACARTGIDPNLPPVKPEEQPQLRYGEGLAGGIGKAEGRPLKLPKKKPAGSRAPAGWRLQFEAMRRRNRR